jgi:hypothetical protein
MSDAAGMMVAEMNAPMIVLGPPLPASWASSHSPRPG